MAVMQTPQGRVIGLILQQDQPKAKPAMENEPVIEENEIMSDENNAVGEEKVEPVPKKPGRPAKK